MFSLWPSTITSLNDTLAQLSESVDKLKAAQRVDIAEVITELKMAAESARNLHALVLSEMPDATWQNREELEVILEKIEKRVEARHIEELRTRLLNLAAELERGNIVHRRAVRVTQLNQLRDQAINELRAQASVKGTPQNLPGPDSDEWLVWACGLKEPEDSESLQALRNGFAHLDEFIANLEPDMWAVKTETLV
jgi:hypothetical protein